MLRVTGVVGSINKDIVDDAYLVLRTTEFAGVHAKFQGDVTKVLAGFSKGEKVTVKCRGNGYIINSPMLSDCVVE